MSTGKKLRNYTSEFRQQAMTLADELGSYRIAAERLGVPGATLYNWLWQRKQRGVAPATAPSKATAPGPAAPSAIELQDELRRVRKELEHERKVNQILKAAAAFFSQDHLK